MGGDAIKNCIVRKYSRKEYFEIMQEVLERLIPEFEKVYVPRKFENKSLFGDLDILYIPKATQSIDKERIQKLFPESKEIIMQSPTSHFEFKEFQIDIQCCSPEEFDLAKYYFEFGDAGMIMGIMAHSSGFHFGYNGVFVEVLSDEESKTRDVLYKIYLCKKPETIWEFFGLDIEQWKKGFEDEKECADYLMKSRFFKPFMFRENKLSTKSSERKARQRPFISYFEKYISTLFPNESEDLAPEEFRERKRKLKRDVLDYFQKRSEYEEIRDTIMKKRTLKATKIDGARLGKELGLEGKSLGQFIASFKSQFIDFEKYLEEKSSESVLEDAKYYKSAIYDKKFIKE